MEKFRIRVRNEPKRGHIWELHLFPQYPHQQLREADARIMGSASTPEVTLWLRRLAEPALLRAEAPSPIAAEAFGPEAEPRWLRLEDGMRLALAFACARYLVKAEDRRRFSEGLQVLPSEVLLYWFTLCFYGYRQAAGRVALRTLLTHEEPEERPRQTAAKTKPASPRRQARQQRLALDEEQGKAVREDLGRYSSAVLDKAGATGAR
jgi:hypothetical protein